MSTRVIAFVAAALAVLNGVAQAQVTFRVTADPKVAPALVSGRLVISLIADGAPLPPRAEPNDAPFWDAPQPMFGVDVANLAGGAAFTMDAATRGEDWSLAPLKDLAPGKYRAQARLITARRSSNWSDDAGNLTSLPQRFEFKAGEPVTVDFTLNGVTATREFRSVPGAELFEIKSELLSAFHRREVKLRAGVVLPTKVEPGKQYAAVYEIPGFGGDHRGASHRALGLASRRDQDGSAMDAATYWIILDPESPNGHHLFCDSANNGPVGEALVKELIPALEAKYQLAPKPEARLLRGHSSGGWSTVWLAINYPQTFGAAWATSPDPVDLHAFQLVDIYSAENFYVDPKTGKDFVSYRKGERDLMTIRQENGGERVLGANQTSGQQWHSWAAAWGPREGTGGGGHPAALYDSVTGVINKGVLDHYRKYDVVALVKSDPARYADPLRRNVRLAVGDADDFCLNVAVGMLKQALDALPAAPASPAVRGYIHILPGLDHGTIMGHPSVRAISAEMLEHLRASGLAPAAPAAPSSPPKSAPSQPAPSPK